MSALPVLLLAALALAGSVGTVGPVGQGGRGGHGPGGAGGDPPAPRVEAPPAPAPIAQLTVRAGRAELVQGRSIATLTRASGARSVVGDAFCELGPGAEVDVAWPGGASLRVRGPASLEWGPATEVRVLRASRIELEVRRGARTLALGGAYVLALERGALAIEGRASGDYVVENRGGADVAIRRDGTPYARLSSGRALLLPVRAPSAAFGLRAP